MLFLSINTGNSFCFYLAWRAMAKRISKHDSSFGVSDQQSVGPSPGNDTCVLKKDTYPLSLRLLDGNPYSFP